MSAEVRKVLLRLLRKARSHGRSAERNGSAGSAYAFSLMGEYVSAELQKLDKPKKRATKKAARK